MNTQPFQVGDKVTIRPEFQDDGDDAITFVIIEAQSPERVTIEAQLGMAINPTQVCLAAWLQKA